MRVSQAPRSRYGHLCVAGLVRFLQEVFYAREGHRNAVYPCFHKNVGDTVTDSDSSARPLVKGHTPGHHITHTRLYLVYICVVEITRPAEVCVAEGVHSRALLTSPILPHSRYILSNPWSAARHSQRCFPLRLPTGPRHVESDG